MPLVADIRFALGRCLLASDLLALFPARQCTAVSSSFTPSPQSVLYPLPSLRHRPYGLNVPYRKLFARFEEIVLRHAGKPHWAKAHPLRPEGLRAMYPHFDDFVRVLEDVDPQGVFRNPYVDRHIFGKTGEGYGARVFKREY